MSYHSSQAETIKAILKLYYSPAIKVIISSIFIILTEHSADLVNKMVDARPATVKI